MLLHFYRSTATFMTFSSLCRGLARSTPSAAAGHHLQRFGCTGCASVRRQSAQHTFLRRHLRCAAGNQADAAASLAQEPLGHDLSFTTAGAVIDVVEEGVAEDAAEAASAVDSSTSEAAEATPDTVAEAAAPVAVPAGGDVAAEADASPAASNGLTSASVEEVARQWDQNWQALVDYLHAADMFPVEDGEVPTDAARVPVGAAKRALLGLSRARPDLLYSLPLPLIDAVLAAGMPFQDRKLVNADKRLRASFSEGQSLHVSHGGAAAAQDLIRYVHATVVLRQLEEGHEVEGLGTVKKSPGLVAAVAALMPELLRIVAAEAEPAAVKRAEAAQAASSSAARPSAAPRGWEPDETGAQPRNRGMRGPAAAAEQPRVRPGDWFCPECSAQNFASRTECFRCRLPRGDVADAEVPPPVAGNRLPGDWDCPECGQDNFARRTSCFRCGKPRAGAAGATGGRFNIEMREGDWMCPACTAHNFASKAECYRCALPRPAEAGPPVDTRRRGNAPSREPWRGGMGSRSDRGPPEARPGDWACPSCGIQNFSYRTECFKCGAAGPPGAGSGGSRGPRQEATGRSFSGYSRPAGDARPRDSGTFSQEAVSPKKDGAEFGDGFEW